MPPRVPEPVRTPHRLPVALSKPCSPTIATGPCPPTLAGPDAAWMPRKRLHGRTRGVSCEGGRARALQPTHGVEGAARTPHRLPVALSKPCTPIISTGPCPPTVAGPYAAWMPRKSLQGRTCGVSCEGGRARAVQPDRRSHALLLLPLPLLLLLPRPHCPVPTRKQPAYESWRGTTR
ncbi:hypothetical protein XarbCFBP8150_20335 [Xanthomonas arboricola]|nr:hypothetical protein XarbCFBP8150_20335 [Xanthomonas arboricola]